MSGGTVAACSACVGLTFTLDPCQCTWGGDRFLVDEQRSGGQPYRDCLLCRGDGAVARPCRECGQRGERRSQLVLTVVNADTGAVASANVTAGGIEPRQAADKRWELPLTPLISELAAVVGATALSDISTGWRPLGHEYVALPREWRPDLPAERRDALVAAALADCSHNPWRVFHGRSIAAPTPDPNGRLAQLCRLADILFLDLVIEARNPGNGVPTWDIRYETPGGGVPATPRVRADDLPTALTSRYGTASIADVFDGFDLRGHDAPAHYLRAGAAPPDLPDPVDLDQVERRMIRDCEGWPGAQAIWRNGRWWHTTLRPSRVVETLTEQPTGQVSRQITTELVRAWEPPAPNWLGEPIPYHDCPDCDPGSSLRACHTCRDSRRVYHGAVVTVTDLGDRVTHANWSRQPVDAPQVATQPGGKPVVQPPSGTGWPGWPVASTSGRTTSPNSTAVTSSARIFATASSPCTNPATTRSPNRSPAPPEDAPAAGYCCRPGRRTHHHWPS